MAIIFKYPLNLTSQQTLRLPKGSKILKVAFQGPQLTLWAFVDEGQPLMPRRVWIVGTGWNLDTTEVHVEPEDYVDTVLQPPISEYVWHIFVEKEAVH
jgi:hypothetical protein